ncbi:fatty acid desaturase [Ancylobacter sp. Lp-2]|uniref:fatty acid desaturase n=1 Tax=Ancylobacter sp. Lp-2 TaxID=2881339 RepID=UPI001E4D7C22|nr:fatty acid desaturase [Ancylobacter sp. Lp-2]MCB4768786.1 fatty acid desaturase [Ancylobacter sp. Lp-2]
MPHSPRLEWPTIGLAVLIYGGWLALTWWWEAVPFWMLCAVGGWLVAWQGSLQHEVMHGHPTRSRRINDAVGWPPLSVWLPYPIYRSSHLRHHRDEHLTDPIEDPESVYLRQTDWDRLGGVTRLLLRFNMTLVGRLTLGPFIMIGGFLWTEARAVWRGEGKARRIWARHALGVAGLLAWVVGVCGMPLATYLFGFVYVGAALTRLRSFAEHRFAEEHEERTAIVEKGGLLGLLYLNNNLHVLHHLRPHLPWYRLPAVYRDEREDLVERNGGLVYAGYLDVARRFLLRAHDDPRHPKAS